MTKFKKTLILRGLAYYNDTPPVADPPPTPILPPAGGDKKFSQADVDRFMAEERRKLTAKQQELTKQLETLSQSANLTAEEKANLQAQLDDVKNASLTKEQQLTRDLEKHKELVKTTTENLTKERDTWQGRYGTLLVRQKILEAAASSDPVTAEQILELLVPRAKVVEVAGEDGKGSGEFDVLIKFNDTDVKTKKDIVVDLNPLDTVKRMKELPERFGNLFKSGVTGGVGKGKSGAVAGEPDISKMTQDQYREYRKTRTS